MRSKLDPLEREILEHLLKKGDKGITQEELLPLLNVDKRSCSRALLRLEKKGFIERRRAVVKGKKTYVIKPVLLEKKLLELYNAVRQIPCFRCPYLFSCAEGGDPSPEKCRILLSFLKGVRSELAKN
ncbi:MAG: hypothetical protein DRJ52_02960 [Thermoprotei archaeon]|nr:MAG: hypothetical protein DRJ52_02960 [Thermoprotei archaeon]RLF01040.1 MAG: hypothetical protein DRJ63_00455 [Thermoprotei archaeon]HDI74442.1 winged helix-turn-helix transcriptional regulator [Thermoprotei archaeon]